MALLAVTLVAAGFFGNLQPGPRPVGFTVKEAYDAQRDERPKLDADGKPIPPPWTRPMQVGFWYPARASAQAARAGSEVRRPAARASSEVRGPAGRAAASRALRLIDYAQLRSHERNFHPPTAAELEAESRGFRQALAAYSGAEVTEAAARAAGEQRGIARRDAKRAPGRFPLIVFVGHDPGIEALWGEWLASRGYVVAAFPEFGARGHGPPGVQTTSAIETRVRDLEYVEALLRDDPSVDIAHLGLIAYGTEAMPALLYEMRNSAVQALVTLAGWELHPRGVALLRQMPGYDPSRVRSPLLQVRGGPDPRTPTDLAFESHALYADRLRVSFPGVDGFDFLSVTYAAGQGDEKGRAGFEQLTAMVGAFLDARLSADPSASAKVAALAAPLPLHEEEKGLAGVPLADELIRKATDARDVAGVAQAIRAGSKRGPQFLPLAEVALNNLAYEVMGTDRLGDALVLFRLNAELHPDSGNAYDSLGEALLEHGDKQQGIEAYQRSLTLDPGNGNAVQVLARLGIPPAKPVASGPGTPAAAPAAPAAPPAPGSEPLVYRLPGMEKAKVRRDLVFREDGPARLKLDVYRPAAAREGDKLPAVVFISGVAPEQRVWNIYQQWAQLVSATGMAAVLYEGRNGSVSDAEAALSWVRAHGAEQGIDPERLAVWSSSANGRVGVAVMAVPRPWLRCAVLYYPAAEGADPRPDLPVLLIRSGRDGPGINSTIDAYLRQALQSNAPVELVNARNLQHAFDTRDDLDESRRLIAGTLSWLSRKLGE